MDAPDSLFFRPPGDRSFLSPLAPDPSWSFILDFYERNGIIEKLYTTSTEMDRWDYQSEALEKLRISAASLGAKIIHRDRYYSLWLYTSSRAGMEMSLHDELFNDWVKLLEDANDAIHSDGCFRNSGVLSMKDSLGTLTTVGLLSRSLCEKPPILRSTKSLIQYASQLRKIGTALCNLLSCFTKVFSNAHGALEYIRRFRRLPEEPTQFRAILTAALSLVDAKASADDFLLCALLQLEANHDTADAFAEWDDDLWDAPADDDDESMLQYMRLPEAEPQNGDTINSSSWQWGSRTWHGTLQLVPQKLPKLFAADANHQDATLDWHLNRGIWNTKENMECYYIERLFYRSPWMSHKMRLFVADHVAAGRTTSGDVEELLALCDDSMRQYNPTLTGSLMSLQLEDIKQVLRHDLMRVVGLKAYAFEVIYALRELDSFATLGRGVKEDCQFLFVQFD